MLSKRRKLFVGLVVLVLSLSLLGCGVFDDDNDDNGEDYDVVWEEASTEHFTMKYPAEWEKAEEDETDAGSGVVFLTEDELANLMVEADDLAESEVDAEDWMDEIETELEGDYGDDYEFSEIELAGESGKQYIYEEDFNEILLIVYDVLNELEEEEEIDAISDYLEDYPDEEAFLEGFEEDADAMFAELEDLFDDIRDEVGDDLEGLDELEELLEEIKTAYEEIGELEYTIVTRFDFAASEDDDVGLSSIAFVVEEMYEMQEELFDEVIDSIEIVD